MNNLIPHFILDQYQQKNYSGEFTAFTMFVDISGFTQLTETLMQYNKDGAEVLTDVLNNIFDPLVENIYQNKGFLSTFAGDAFTAIFPISNITDKKLYELVVNSAKYVNSFFEANKTADTKFGKFEMGVKVGLSYGGVNWGILGKGGKHTYYFRGKAIDGCAKSEHHAEKGDIIIDKQFVTKLKNTIPQPTILKLLNDKTGNAFFKLDTFSINYELSKTTVKKLEFKEDDLIPFTLNAVINLKDKAEFREVVSIFISFDEPTSEESLNKFTTELVERSYSYGGYFNKIDFGDKGGVALIIFGAPISYENNIERALNFILDIKKESLNIDFRAGITYGTVYAGIMGGKRRCEYTAIGDIVNLSARFMMKSNRGEFWVSKEISNNQQVTHEFKDLGSFQFKGKSGRISAYELIKRKEKAQNSFFEGKTFGREEELKILEKFVVPIFKKNKSTGVLYVYGEAGIGKSRLVWELKKSIVNYELRIRNSRINWFTMPCEEIMRKSFNPVIYFMNNYFDLSIENTNDENRSKFELRYSKLIDSTKNNEIKKELIRTTSILGGYLGLEWKNSIYSQLDAKGRYENFLFAFTTFIQAESLIKPVIIEIEDTHWIDSDSEKLLKILTRNIKKYPISIICPSRYNDDGSEFKLKIDKEVKTDKIDLNFLKKNSISEYGKDILKTENDFSTELLDFIFEKTNGNPFFVEQILLDLQDRDVIAMDTRKGSTYKQMTVTQNNLKNIPSNIQAVVISRLDRLSNEIKNIVQTASVLGREFLIKILTQVLKHEKELDRKLTNIEEEKIWSSLSKMNYLFKHALLRDSAYDMQLRAKLKELHKFAAESYIEVFGGEVKEYFGEIAYHFEKAEVKDKTIEYLEKAGDFAKEIYQNEKGIEYYNRLILFIKKNDLPLLGSTLIKKGDILKLVGKMDDAFSDFESSLKICEELGDNKGIAVAVGSMGSIFWRQGNYSKAMEYYEKDLKISEEIGDKNEIANAIGNMGLVYHNQGNYLKAMECFEKKLKISEELENKIYIAIAIGNIGIIYQNQGNYSKALEYFEKRLKISEELEYKIGIASAIGSIGNIYDDQGNYPEAMECYKKQLKISKELGNKIGISTSVGNMGAVYHNQGNYLKAKKCYEKHLKVSEELGDKSGVSIAVGNIGLIYHEQGNFSKAMECYEKYLKISEELGDKNSISIAVGNMGNTYHNQGCSSKAMECYERALTIDYELNLKPYLPYHLSSKVECLYKIQEYSKAKETNDKCYIAAKEVGSEKHIFFSNILKEKIDFKLLGDTQEKLKVINNLKNILKDEKEEEIVATINYELAIMDYELKLDNSEYKKIAVKIYNKLYKKTPKIEYKNKLEEMEKL